MTESSSARMGILAFLASSRCPPPQCSGFSGTFRYLLRSSHWAYLPRSRVGAAGSVHRCRIEGIGSDRTAYLRPVGKTATCKLRRLVSL